MEHFCHEQVEGAGQWGSFIRTRCQRLGKVERDGKWYCGTHDPVKVEERRAKQDEKYRLLQEKWRRDDVVKRQKEERSVSVHSLCEQIPNDLLDFWLERGMQLTKEGTVK